MLQTATIVYSRSRSLSTVLIRGADRWGRFSHCGVVTPNDTVIEARLLGGVIETPRDKFNARASHQELVHIPVFDLDAGLEWLSSQRGKGYDVLAILGNIARESWQDEDRWQCAELVETFLTKCGRPRFRPDAWRISPTQSWSVL